jgi:hypothetical protein
VSELLSRFGATTREDLAELMERERRSPGERVKGWMAGFAGLVPLKVTGTSVVVAGAAGAVSAVAIGAMVLLPSSPSSPAVGDVTSFTEPDGAIWTVDDAVAAGNEMLKQLPLVSSAALLELNVDTEDLLLLVDWRPQATQHQVTSISTWYAAARQPVDVWVLSWQGDARGPGGSALFPDGLVTVHLVMEDGKPGLPLAYYAEVRHGYTGAKLAHSSGLLPHVTGPMMETQAFLETTANRFLVQAILDGSRTQTFWIEPVVGATFDRVPPPPPQIAPLQIFLHESVAKVRVQTADGLGLHLGIQNRPPDPGGQSWVVAHVPPTSEPITVIAYDADGNELGRREYPPNAP